jgi:hypothetical protein
VGQLSILDAQGRSVKTTEINTNDTQVNIETLEAGVYFVLANNQTIRFVKK